MSSDENGELVCLVNFNRCNKDDENEKVQRSDEEEKFEWFETFNNSENCTDEKHNASTDVHNSHALRLNVLFHFGIAA
jgi:hypothetical protein